MIIYLLLIHELLLLLVLLLILHWLRCLMIVLSFIIELVLLLLLFLLLYLLLDHFILAIWDYLTLCLTQFIRWKWFFNVLCWQYCTLCWWLLIIIVIARFVVIMFLFIFKYLRQCLLIIKECARSCSFSHTNISLCLWMLLLFLFFDTI